MAAANGGFNRLRAFLHARDSEKKLFNLPDFLTQRDKANSFEHLFEGARLETIHRNVSLRCRRKVCPDTHMGQLLDPVQKCAGRDQPSPSRRGAGTCRRTAAASTMTVQQASALTHRAIKHFKERVVANGGKHPRAASNLRDFQTKQSRKSNGILWTNENSNCWRNAARPTNRGRQLPRSKTLNSMPISLSDARAAFRSSCRHTTTSG